MRSIVLFVMLGCGGADPGRADVGSADAASAVCRAAGESCESPAGCCDGLNCFQITLDGPRVCLGEDGCLDDGQKNGLETGVDCGAACERRCGEGQGCQALSNDCAPGLYCPAALGVCTTFPTSGRSCRPGETSARASNLPPHSPDTPDCRADEYCFFSRVDACLIALDCATGADECCDDDNGAGCFPRGTQVPCTQPRGFCGPRP